MRVANKTIYDTQRLHLSQLSYNLKQANEVISTGNRINQLSDDPIGLAQVLNIKSTLSGMDQLTRNIQMGKSWLTAGETALTNVKDMIMEVRTRTLQWANASLNSDQREDAVEVVQGMIDQILALSNTQVSGSYIFGGSNTTTKAFAYDDADSPRQVLYQGDDLPFSVKTEQSFELKVGRNGEDVFWDDSLKVDHTNNTVNFREKVGYGDLGYEIRALAAGDGIKADDVNATVQNYDALKLSTPMPEGTKPLTLRWDGKGNWDVFNDPGYGLPASISGSDERIDIDLDDDGQSDLKITLDTPVAAQGGYIAFDVQSNERILSTTIPDGDYTRTELARAIQTALNEESAASGFGANYEVTYDENTRKYSVKNDGTYQIDGVTHTGYFEFQSFWESSENVGVSKLRNVKTGNGIPLDDTSVTVNNNDALVYGTPYPLGSEPMRLTWDGDSNWLVTNNPGYPIPDSISGSADYVEIDLGEDSRPDLIVNLATPAEEGGFVEFDIIPNIGRYSIGPDIAFEAQNNSLIPIVSDNEVNLFTIDDTNNEFNFEEVDVTGASSGELTAAIQIGDYSDLNEFAAAVENAMEAASAASGFGVDYDVFYDWDTNKFKVRQENLSLSELNLLWKSGSSTESSDVAAIMGIDSLADDMVDFPVSDTEVTLKSITAANNQIDFVEVDDDGVATALAATIANGDYTDMDSLAAAIETAMEAASAGGPNVIDYSVAYDSETERFSIKAEGNALNELQLLWTTGANAVTNAATELGYVDRPSGSFGINGALAANGWGVGDTINIEFSDGFHNSVFNYTIAGGDTTASVLGLIKDQLDRDFGTENADFTVNGNDIDFTFYTNRKFNITNFTDSAGGNAQLTLSSSPVTVMNNSGTLLANGDVFAANGGDGVSYVTSSDDITTYDVVADDGPPLFTIDGSNNIINFTEDHTVNGLSNELTAYINPGVYRTAQDMELAIEDALESASAAAGNFTDYRVTYSRSGAFTIAENTGVHGMFGGDYVGTNNWDNSENISFDLQFGASTVNVNVNTDATASNNEVADQIAASLGISQPNGSVSFSDPAGQLTITRVGNDFKYTTTNGMALNVSNLNDAGTGDAILDVSSRNGSTIGSLGGSGSVSISPGAGVLETISDAAPAALNEFQMLWNSGTNTANNAAETLGFGTLTDSSGSTSYTGYQVDPISIVEGENNKIDFKEVMADGTEHTLVASLSGKTYHNLDELATDVQNALTNASATTGTTVTYSVDFDYGQNAFVIRGNSPDLEELHFLWKSGDNGFFGSQESIASTLGFDTGEDDVVVYAMESDHDVVLFNVDDLNDQVAFKETDENGVTRYVEATIDHGEYTNAADMAAAIESAMEEASARDGFYANYTVTYDAATKRFGIEENGTQLHQLQVLWDESDSIASDIGMSTPITRGKLGLGANWDNGTNYSITFSDGYRDPFTLNFVGGATTNATLNNIDAAFTALLGTRPDLAADGYNANTFTVNGDYLEVELPNSRKLTVSNFTEAVGSDAELKFVGYTSQDTNTLNGPSIIANAGDRVSFFPTPDIMNVPLSDESPTLLTIDDTNNLMDFKEITSGFEGSQVCELCATIPEGNYADLDTLASAIETAMEKESANAGNGIDYAVTYDNVSHRFTIKENGTTLDELQVLWETGENGPVSQGGTGKNAAAVLGFDAEDDQNTTMQSDEDVRWGIFDTLIDLKTYLGDDDVDGVFRTISRLDTHFDHFKSTIADTGIKYNRLEVTDSIIVDLDLAFEERRTMIEEADMVKAYMDLTSTETAYQASLSSSARVLQVSLVDYLK